MSCIAVEVLQGHVNDQEIDVILDSVTRRILASDVSRTVTLVQQKKHGS